jgi:hypothetical protein
MPEVSASEAGRRCSDIISLHILAGDAGRWAAVRLSDGGSDGIAYDTRADAVRHQLHETLCAYVKIPRDAMPPAEATRFLGINRMFYDKGLRLIDPDAPEREMILPERTEDLDALMAQILREGIR